ncbi:MAG: DNA repair protein RecO [Lachnospiraceae bacterium]|nr:DNA repair protein RecO [Lachnospiraceae bacterium]
MQDFLKVTGMVIGVFPQGEYDRRVTLLTREQGKITAFAKGARRQGSRFCAATDMFAFGEFDLFVGRTAYNVQDVKISNYFENLRTDMEAAGYAMYFAELAEYYGVENQDESVLLLLLYRALQGLKSDRLANSFVRRVYEIKLFSIEGEFIPIDNIGTFGEGTERAIHYIQSSTIEKLYNFTVEKEAESDLEYIADTEMNRLTDRKFKSLEILKNMIAL